jgi:hypothetical protein
VWKNWSTSNHRGKCMLAYCGQLVLGDGAAGTGKGHWNWFGLPAPRLIAVVHSPPSAYSPRKKVRKEVF